MNNDAAHKIVESMPKPGFFKRLLVICYDLLLLLGVVFVASFVFLLVPDAISQSIAVRAVKVAYLIVVVFCFYGWFWTHGGQTLGMKVWNLYLIDMHGKFLRWPHACLRFVCAIFAWLPMGLGFTWILLSRHNLAWHDMLSKSYIVTHRPNTANN